MLPLVGLVGYLDSRYTGVDWTDAELSRRVGVSRDVVKRWRERGMPWPEADEIAVALGVHPCRIWPDWFVLPS